MAEFHQEGLETLTTEQLEELLRLEMQTQDPAPALRILKILSMRQPENQDQTAQAWETFRALLPARRKGGLPLRAAGGAAPARGKKAPPAKPLPAHGGPGGAGGRSADRAGRRHQPAGHLCPVDLRAVYVWQHDPGRPSPGTGGGGTPGNGVLTRGRKGRFRAGIRDAGRSGGGIWAGGPLCPQLASGGIRAGGCADPESGGYGHC